MKKASPHIINQISNFFISGKLYMISAITLGRYLKQAGVNNYVTEFCMDNLL